MQKLTGLNTIRPPGAPSHRHEIEQRFREQIETEITSEKVAEAVGVSREVGTMHQIRCNGQVVYATGGDEARASGISRHLPGRPKRSGGILPALRRRARYL